MEITLLTAHKGVDLHAATALQVMHERLEGGPHLVGLFRCRWHTVAGNPDAPEAASLLETGRHYNPNKHHYGLFGRPAAGVPWFRSPEHILPRAWPGEVQDSDLDPGPDLYDRLLGGRIGAGRVAVDIVTLVRGQSEEVVSGVLWRLVLTAPGNQAAAIATGLAVARRRKEGLLLNPHLEDWLVGPVQPG